MVYPLDMLLRAELSLSELDGQKSCQNNHPVAEREAFSVRKYSYTDCGKRSLAADGESVSWATEAPPHC